MKFFAQSYQLIVGKNTYEEGLDNPKIKTVISVG